MESTNMLSWEQRTLISELIRGMEAAKQLQAQLGAAPSPVPATSSPYSTVAETNELLAQQVVSSYEKALSMFNWAHPPTLHPITPTATTVPVMNSGGIPESPVSINGSPRSEEFVDVATKESNSLLDYSFNPKKRKMMPRWTEQVRISPERGLEGPQDDGYSWRKYGQKDILGAKYPRSYYRCTYRNTQKCYATKQVQRSDGDPTVFDVTYRGKHTCSQQSQVHPHAQDPSSPQKNETKKPENDMHYQKDLLDSLRTNLTVRTEGLDGHPFSFPAAPFYSADFGGGGFCHVGGCEPSDFPGLLSANTSTGSSPIFDVDFQFDPTVEMDLGFTSFLHEQI